MIMAGAWWAQDPGPEPAYSKRDEAYDRGFDPEGMQHVTREPLGEQWQAWLDGSVRAAEHRRDPEMVDARCGTRCDSCDERTCQIDGPELRACGVTCVDCKCDCTACQRAREDLRADLQHRIKGEEGRRWI